MSITEGEDSGMGQERIMQLMGGPDYFEIGKTLSDDDLWLLALAGDEEDEAAWNAVYVLQCRGTPEVLDAALGYCQSPREKERARGHDVLAQLGTGKPDSERPYRDKCVAMAINALRDQSEMVVHSAAWALNHLGTPAGVDALVKLKGHPNQGVRHAVAASIAISECEKGIATLIELSEDIDAEVRDWATFGLGSHCEEDTPKIRAALRKRLADAYEDAREEATWGLAKRRDPEGLKLLLERLESQEWFHRDEDAAQEALGLQGKVSVEQLCSGLRSLLAQ